MRAKRTWVAAIVSALAGVAVLIGLSRLESTERAAPPAPKAKPQRIICMAPNLAETLFALGAADRIAGVSAYTLYPPEALRKPNVGALYNPDLERIVSLDPDLIIVQHKHERIRALADKRGIRVLAVDMEADIATMKSAVLTLGDELGLEKAATDLCAKIDADLAAVRSRTAGRPVVPTMICVDRSAGSLKSMYCAGGKSFLTDVLTVAGGRNIFADKDQAYFAASIEEIVRRAPEAIVETRPSTEPEKVDAKKVAAEWNALETVPAVRNDRVQILTDSFIVVPGPRVGLIARRLAEALHPEAME